ncbi:DUF445 domain-containing protein [Peribacillus psychrosaccharolyticus]|uniref:DUF445 domain-containing protein n=2 Tax=Peribacillus psychrosaccharolyticus TaxID=1407 RepID=A0A974NM15_PERPY|nr:DUF445 domain-containing protein [Peribacillus psychrosaccharolyticus]MEC2056657.1 DUF445 domain-containing protein [Peribacillus psychrosaccharolyticus]MED3745790.1 DUF445 domain-containing protein [Peribacillus psychrosaccharolyticus]QQT00213.1 DUF445 domain-containing protein [Peribacillus psychrosaccharolyticus]
MEKKEKSSKKIARYSLFIMIVGFLATLPFQDSVWAELIRGGFEAGLVGGLADWFAVTALFRHPLGIPIPHTALLPANRKRMTNALVTMLKTNWLSKESIQEKIKQIPFTEKLIHITKRELAKEAVQKAIVELIKKMITNLPIEKAVPLLKKHLLSVISDIEIKHILHTASQQLLKEKFDEKALNYVLNKADTWLRNKDTPHQLGSVSMNVLRKVEADGILQFALKSIQNLLTADKLGDILRNILLNVVTNLKPENDANRKALLLYIRNELLNIEDNAEIIEGIAKWRNKLLDTWNPDQMIHSSLQGLQQSAVSMIEQDSFRDNLLSILTQFLNKLAENGPALDGWIKNQIGILVDNNHEQIGLLVQENLDKLDNETLIYMMENSIGKDLQWIRVNGAVCGFFIGIVLTGFQALISLF